jgi:hypothetical protein
MTTTVFQRLLVAAAISATTMLITTAGSAAHADTVSSDLVCEGTQTLVFSPPVTNTQRDTTVTGTALLNDCFSPTGTNTDIVSGKATISATGSDSCTQVGNEDGTVIFTWYSGAHQSGNLLGTTTVPYVLSERPDFADNELASEQKGISTLASSRLTVDTMTASSKLTAASGSCTAGGITEQAADLSVDFAPVL